MKVVTPPARERESADQERPVSASWGPFSPDSEAGCILGIAVEPDKTTLVMAQEGGSVLSRRDFPTDPERGLDAFLDEVAAACDQMRREQSPLVCVSVTAAGPIDAQRGALLAPADIPGWSGTALADKLAERLNVRVFLMNAARAGAYAEWRFGAGRSEYVRKLLFLSLGAWPQFGVVYNGSLMDIPGDLDVSLGTPAATPATNGRPAGKQRGYHEPEKRAYRSFHPTETLFELADLVPELLEQPEDLDLPEDMQTPADHPDRLLGWLCGSLMNQFAPDVIVLGAPPEQIDEDRLKRIRAAAAERARPHLAERGIITRSSLGNYMTEIACLSPALWNGYPRNGALGPSTYSQLHDLGRLAMELLADRVFLRKVDEVSNRVVRTLSSGGKILACGNGSSAVMAAHLVEQLVGRYRGGRVSLPALNLSGDAALMSSISNEFGYEVLFSRQIQGLGREGDLFIAICPTGKSPNVVRALLAAKKLGLHTMLLTGRKTDNSYTPADFVFHVPHDSLQRVQEIHSFVIHAICEKVESQFHG